MLLSENYPLNEKERVTEKWKICPKPIKRLTHFTPIMCLADVKMWVLEAINNKVDFNKIAYMFFNLC